MVNAHEWEASVLRSILGFDELTRGLPCSGEVSHWWVSSSVGPNKIPIKALCKGNDYLSSMKLYNASYAYIYILRARQVNIVLRIVLQESFLSVYSHKSLWINRSIQLPSCYRHVKNMLWNTDRKMFHAYSKELMLNTKELMYPNMWRYECYAKC